MVKGSGKSSASSGTRKKHARKAAGNDQPELIAVAKKVKPKEKAKAKEPRVKVYIPPTKPAPTQLDPLETSGLALRLRPDLLIVLRKFGKKDGVTKTKALQELQSEWIEKAKFGGVNDLLVHELIDMLPVWMHHVSAFFIHSSRRIRALASAVHTSLLQIPPVRQQMFFHLKETASSDQAESIIGTWCMASRDIDSQVSTLALNSWASTVTLFLEEGSQKLVLDEYLLPRLLSFLNKALLSPMEIYSNLNPAAPASAPHGKRIPGITSKKSEEPARSKGEDEGESELDRDARLRVGALGSIRWLLEARSNQQGADTVNDLSELLSNIAFWTVLQHAESTPYAEVKSFGFAQPSVRKAAWMLVETLLDNWKESTKAYLEALSTAILRSAWVEPDVSVRGTMWKALLTFLTSFPSSWEIERLNSGEETKDEDSDEEGETERVASEQSNKHSPSLAFQEFLQFLELGCAGSPTKSYPAVVIILSTIPYSIFTSTSSTPLTSFFSSFWAAIDGRALSSLNRVPASNAFLSALLESMVFTTKRLRGEHGPELVGLEGPDITQVSKDLVASQFARVWDELSVKRLGADLGTAGTLLAKTLLSLENFDRELFDTGWRVLQGHIGSKEFISGSAESFISLSILHAFEQTFPKESDGKAKTRSLTGSLIQSSISRCKDVLAEDDIDEEAANTSVAALVQVLGSLGDIVLENSTLLQELDGFANMNTNRLALSFPNFLGVYFSLRKDEERCLQLWHTIIRQLTPGTFETIIPHLLEGIQAGALPNYLRPKGDELDALVAAVLTSCLNNTAGLQNLRQIILHSKHFVSESGRFGLFQIVADAFNHQLDEAIIDSRASLAHFEIALDLIQILIRQRPELALGAAGTLIPNVFILAYLLPRTRGTPGPATSMAQHLWTSWLLLASQDSQKDAKNAIMTKLKVLVADTHSVIGPDEILDMVNSSPPGLVFNLLADVFPSRDLLDELLADLSPDPLDASLAVLDSLIPPESKLRKRKLKTQVFDLRGLSSYARVVSGLLRLLSEDRQIARSNIWALKHLLCLSQYAEEFCQVASESYNAFGKDCSIVFLQDIISRTRQLATYLLTSHADEGWRSGVIMTLSKNPTERVADPLAQFFVDLIVQAKEKDNIRDSIIVRNVLQHVLDSATIEQADKWVQFAKQTEKTAPQTSMAIIAAVTLYAPEPPSLTRYRNEMAAGMLGVKPGRAKTEGVLLLRKLIAAAPEEDSEIEFLPVQRAVNLVKVFQQWISGEDDLDEDVITSVSMVLCYLAPILQNTPGSHWELIFDVIESNIESSSFAEASTLVSLFRTFKLIKIIEDLTSTNKALRADWLERRTQILVLVRDLVATPLDPEINRSASRSVCREIALSVVQDLPASLLDYETLPKMCHLLLDPSSDVKKLSYQMLRPAAQKRTEHFVIEGAVETDDAFEATLPIELIEILQRGLPHGDDHTEREASFSFMLGWMLLFDLFVNASLRVRSSYIDQLRAVDIISTNFIPNIFDTLKIAEGMSQAFKLDIWGVDEFYIQEYDTSSSISLPLLAAHLYYRSLLIVPSFIRSWVLDCRDFQVKDTAVKYTAQHFSPVIIRTELDFIKSPQSTVEFAHENFNVKVANAVNEVTATYLVDDQPLEITLKMPRDWPLKGIEIREKRVGVQEDRWRAWVLGVQQSLWAHNGRVADGVALFKKNAALHFEGQVECAICYSIISVMDGSLPRKPCKTCKNRFHASCLYKWFNSSHSSSCPLCRSDII